MKDLLAYVHPLVQVLVLLMALATLRLGLALKKHRTGQRHLAQWEGIYNRHTQLGLIFVSCLLGGYLLGLLSMPLTLWIGSICTSVRPMARMRSAT